MPTPILTRSDFRQASYRNIFVCKELMKALANEKQVQNQNFLLQKMYYLLGYVIEYNYKYALFSHLGLERNQNVYDYGDELFKESWKDHSFQKLAHICQSNHIQFSADIPYLGAAIPNSEVKILIQSWDVQIRYSLKLAKNKVKLNQNAIQKMLEIVEIITNELSKKYN